MYKVVVYWRWDKGTQTADCFWCVPWPDMTDEEFEQEVQFATVTMALADQPPMREAEVQDKVLRDMGYPEAAAMLWQLPIADLRARFNQMEMEAFISESPVTREQIEQIKLNRR